MDLKQKILSNMFVAQVRGRLIVDEVLYEELCGSLKELAIDWKGKTDIDKELVQDLYVIPSVIRNIAESIRAAGQDNKLAELLEDKWQKLDELILDCLSA